MFSVIRNAKVIKNMFLSKTDDILMKLDTVLSQHQQLQEELQHLKSLVSQQQLKPLFKPLSGDISGNSSQQDVTALPEEDYHTYFANDFAKYVPTFEGKKVLVVGCGKGEDCSFFIDFGADTVHGLDITENIGCNFQHPKISYFQYSAEEMKFDDCSYDYVYSVAAMEHIHKIDKAFSEMVRVTRPGGMIYCFAGSLWNSREGHHMYGVFKDYPWIHLRLTKQEIIQYCLQNNIDHIQGSDIQDGVEFMFSDYFNFLPAQRYVEVCSQLLVSQIIQNTLSLDPEEFLPEDILLELKVLGYSKKELLTNAHTFIAKK